MCDIAEAHPANNLDLDQAEAHPANNLDQDAFVANGRLFVTTPTVSFSIQLCKVVSYATDIDCSSIGKLQLFNESGNVLLSVTLNKDKSADMLFAIRELAKALANQES